MHGTKKHDLITANQKVHSSSIVIVIIIVLFSLGTFSVKLVGCSMKAVENIEKQNIFQHVISFEHLAINYSVFVSSENIFGDRSLFTFGDVLRPESVYYK